MCASNESSTEELSEEKRECTHAESPVKIVSILTPDMPMICPVDSTRVRYTSKHSSIAKGYGSIENFLASD
jgi:hypothetical protein